MPLSQAADRDGAGALSPLAARTLLAGIVVAACVAGFMVTGTVAAAHAAGLAGADLTRLLRAMAAIKALAALAVTGAVLWRLGAAAAPGWLAAYTLACSAMAVAPGLIWDMAHVGAGALLLHGGLLAALLLLWRDPVAAARLSAIVQRRRTGLNHAAPRAAGRQAGPGRTAC
jgi:hypothetical protein